MGPYSVKQKAWYLLSKKSHSRDQKSTRVNEMQICSRAGLTTLYVNVPNLLRKSIKEGMIGSKHIFIGKFKERMESMLNRNSMSINHKRSLRMTRVKSYRPFYNSRMV